MDFKDILEQWESSSEGQKAAGNGRFSHILQEKEEGLHQPKAHKDRGGYRTGKASMGRLKSMRPQAELDLHGFTGEESRLMVHDFLKESVTKRLQKVRIVHGRGLHSVDGKAVIRDVVVEELQNSPYVRAYGNPPPVEGGSGAVWVILQRGK
ncbi:MAG: Smr/MutS family protein [Sphaerochaetaceae bacterium]|jgi:DNA-nicking Smr family endonuclease|nr:Smr/MutS family protein [Sphaerochaetaceae bacterium]MDD3366155.1 Smr/MutS family protein [Sphaerochaetaceae bacterium]MDD4219055.1 Smr/MutS family protein [Sphaerochaetaceae bacterium]MDY0371460.1 Smr/MutS family protein [Sphaerochaetaceae bacterium]